MTNTELAASLSVPVWAVASVLDDLRSTEDHDQVGQVDRWVAAGRLPAWVEREVLAAAASGSECSVEWFVNGADPTGGPCRVSSRLFPER